MTSREFADRFTVCPDGEVVSVSCFRCPGFPEGMDTWLIGYHPSLDYLIEWAREHDAKYHGSTA